MNCDNHPGTDGIGRCVSCGRVICQACAVRVGGLMHCKVCVEAGRVVGPQPAQPTPPQMQAYPPYSYGPMGEMGFVQPRPRGMPDPRLFRQGAMGSLICLIFLMPGLILSFIYYGASLNHDYSSLTGLGSAGYVFTALSIVQLLSLLLLAQGFRGFYWNYGDPRARSMVPLIYIGVGITIAFEIVFVLADVFNWYSSYGSLTSYYLSPLGILSFLYDIPLAIAYLFTHFSLRAVQFSFPPGSQMRDQLSIAGYLFLIASLLMIIPLNLLTYVNLPPFQDIALAIAFFLLWRIFLKAPLPVPPQPPGAIPPPNVNAPGRTV